MAVNKDFDLDTKSMDETAKMCADLSDKMRNLRQELDNKKNALLRVWDGAGSEMFGKKYHLVVQHLDDLTDELRNMSESIYAAEESYIQTDVDLSKQMDGKEKYN